MHQTKEKIQPFLRNCWEIHDIPLPLAHNHCARRWNYLVHSSESPYPGDFGKKWTALSPFQVFPFSVFFSWSLDLHLCVLHLYINTGLWTLNLSDHCESPYAFDLQMLCGHEPHKLSDTSNNNFIHYKPRFFWWHPASMVQCETAGELFILSPIHCWPLQPAQSCTFWCVGCTGMAVLTL